MEYHLPKYREIPDVGLYLDQVVKYINDKVTPMGFESITSSMVSNYVKKQYVPSPEKKQYSPNIIAKLIVITMAKTALSMDKIKELFQVQAMYDDAETAYDDFCDMLEKNLAELFNARAAEKRDNSGNNDKNSITAAKKMRQSGAAAIAHVIYLNSSFDNPDAGIK